MTAASPALRSHGDTGLTLAEVLVTVVILGVCVVFILGGTTSLPIAAATHRRDAQADIILRDWAEAIKAKGFVASMCSLPNPYAFDQLSDLLPADLSTAGFEVDPPVVETWNGAPETGFVPCDESGAQVVRVALTVKTKNSVHSVSQSLAVVVADQ